MLTREPDDGMTKRWCLVPAHGLSPMEAAGRDSIAGTPGALDHRGQVRRSDPFWNLVVWTIGTLFRTIGFPGGPGPVMTRELENGGLISADRWRGPWARRTMVLSGYANSSGFSPADRAKASR